FGERSCATIFASTFAPPTSGVPTFTPSPSPTRSTSLKVTASPTLPASFSTRSRSPCATRYCFPPVLMTAYMKSPALLGEPGEPRTEVSKPRRRGVGSSYPCQEECKPKLNSLEKLGVQRLTRTWGAALYARARICKARAPGVTGPGKIRHFVESLACQ